MTSALAQRNSTLLRKGQHGARWRRAWSDEKFFQVMKCGGNQTLVTEGFRDRPRPLSYHLCDEANSNESTKKGPIKKTTNHCKRFNQAGSFFPWSHPPVVFQQRGTLHPPSLPVPQLGCLSFPATQAAAPAAGAVPEEARSLDLENLPEMQAESDGSAHTHACWHHHSEGSASPKPKKL